MSETKVSTPESAVATTPQLPFDAAPSRREQAKELGNRLVYWAPVWIPMVVLAQVALGGLRPALAESRRLDREEERMAERLEREHVESARLERSLQAQDDPIFLERERRLLRQADGPLGKK
ncbi:MAG: hypothetical protein FJ298_11770 [Planctomycetes bacterium]|nr:hypothetical protein [Planctomycetota bacterium]